MKSEVRWGWGDSGRAWKPDIYVFLYLDLGATPGSAWAILGRVLRKSLLAVSGTGGG